MDNRTIDEVRRNEDRLINKIELLEKENQELQSQLSYLRSGEYYNQLRFERDMLQHVVDYNEVSKEDKEFIDMTHRNTELLEENQQLKADYGNKSQVERDLLLEENEQLKKELQKYKSLYENEKDKNDTLKRIIKKIEEYIKSQEYFYNDGEESGWDCSIDGYKILDLLKEIK